MTLRIPIMSNAASLPSLIASLAVAGVVAAQDVEPLVLPGAEETVRPTATHPFAQMAHGDVRLSAVSQIPVAKTWAVEDLVQVVVVEQSTERIDQRRDLEKEGLAKAEVAEFSNFNIGSFTFSPSTSTELPGFEIGAEKEFEGQGRYSRKDQMSDRFTAKVAEVKPNGNLVIEARVVRNWSGDQTEITLTGVVNPDWITPAGSILSTQVADLKIDKVHSGAVEDTTQRGFFAEVLNFLFAF